MNLSFREWFRAIATGLMTMLSLMVLMIVWWKAIIVGAIAYLFCAQRFGVRWIERIAFALALFAICVWVEALPSAAEIKAHAKQVVEEAHSTFRR
jgi:hypothetical protein